MFHEKKHFYLDYSKQAYICTRARKMAMFTHHHSLQMLYNSITNIVHQVSPDFLWPFQIIHLTFSTLSLQLTYTVSCITTIRFS